MGEGFISYMIPQVDKDGKQSENSKTFKLLHYSLSGAKDTSFDLFATERSFSNY